MIPTHEFESPMRLAKFIFRLGDIVDASKMLSGRQDLVGDLTMTDIRVELPLCVSRYIDAVTAVRGEGAVLQLLRKSLNLRASARLLYVPEVNCYFVELDDIDRWETRESG